MYEYILTYSCLTVLVDIHVFFFTFFIKCTKITNFNKSMILKMFINNEDINFNKKVINEYDPLS